MVETIHTPIDRAKIVDADEAAILAREEAFQLAVEAKPKVDGEALTRTLL